MSDKDLALDVLDRLRLDVASDRVVIDKLERFNEKRPYDGSKRVWLAIGWKESIN